MCYLGIRLSPYEMPQDIQPPGGQRLPKTPPRAYKALYIRTPVWVYEALYIRTSRQMYEALYICTPKSMYKVISKKRTKWSTKTQLKIRYK